VPPRAAIWTGIQSKGPIDDASTPTPSPDRVD
jgi:hypothetical protein